MIHYELGQGILALVDEQIGYGHSNVGLVIDADGLTVIDTTATAQQGQAVREEILALTEPLGLPIRRIIVTSSRVPFSGGTAAFWPGAYYGSDITSDQLDTPLDPRTIRRLLPELAPAYDDDFATRPITHTVSTSAWLTGAIEVIPAPGESAMNLLVSTPGADVIFLGALGSFGVTPLAFDGDPQTWADTLSRIATVANTFVPGHGPPGGRRDLDELIGYLRAVVAADGDPGAIAAGPWDEWTNRDFDAVNTERSARLRRGDQQIPAAMFALLGLAGPDDNK